MNPYLILIFFSALVLCAFVWDHFGRRLKVPTVLFLLGTGLGLKVLADYAESSGTPDQQQQSAQDED